MARQKKSHFLPRFYLGGFTAEGTADGFLYVTSKRTKQQWRARAKEAAHQRDLFRTTGTSLEPDDIEIAFAAIESEVAPVLRRVIDARQLPPGHDLDLLLHLVALNASRTPGEMTDMEDRVDKVLRSRMADGLTAEVHSRIVQEWRAGGRDTRYVEDLDDLRDRIRGGSVRAVMARDHFLVNGVLGRSSLLVDLLGRRCWTLLVAPANSEFICCDRPVTLLNNVNVPDDSLPQYTDARYDVIMPLSRTLCLVGHAGGSDRTTVASILTVGMVNHITNSAATDCVYSASEDRYLCDNPVYSGVVGDAYRHDIRPRGA